MTTPTILLLSGQTSNAFRQLLLYCFYQVTPFPLNGYFFIWRMNGITIVALLYSGITVQSHKLIFLFKYRMKKKEKTLIKKTSNHWKIEWVKNITYDYASTNGKSCAYTESYCEHVTFVSEDDNHVIRWINL